MNRYMLSLDQGTTSSRAIVFDHAGQARFGVAASLIEAEADEKTRQHLVDGLKKLAAQLTRTLGGQLPA